jgi:hypothetical protein
MNVEIGTVATQFLFLGIFVSSFWHWFFALWTKGWTSLEPKDDMEDKDWPGDDALQEEQEPCRQADHGGQNLTVMHTESSHVPQSSFLHFFCPYGRTMSMHLALRAMIAMTVYYSTYVIRNGSLFATLLQVATLLQAFYDSCILPCIL